MKRSMNPASFSKAQKPGHREGHKPSVGLWLPLQKQSQQAPSPASQEDSWDLGQPQMEPLNMAWLLGHEEVAAARVTGQRPWLDCWPRGGLFL